MELFGRTREMASTRQGMRSLLEGRGVAFALAGEPGIGKTRLATALADEGRALGYAVCWGRAWEAGGAPAYWPWRQVLEGLSPATNRAVPEGPLSLLWGLGRSGDFSTSDPGQARFEVFDAVVRTLREHGERRPVLCVLDDLHAADTASIELASFAVGALETARVGFVVTFREAEASRPAVRDAMARLMRKAQVLPLARLSPDDSAALVRAAMPDADGVLVDALFLGTGGNPLFLLETLRALSSGRAWRHTETLPVAQGVSAVVEERLASLDPEAREVAELGAVLGREVDGELLSHAWGRPLSALRVAARRLVEGGLWNPLGEDRWQLSHALVRDAIEHALDENRRAVLHRSAAEVLDRHVAAGRSELALARAHHALRALPLGDPIRVAAWVIAAAQQARAQRAYEEGVTLLERARRELPFESPGAAVPRAELLLALGWARGDLGDTDAMLRAFEEARTVARQTGDPVLFARAVLGAGSHYIFGTIRHDLIASIDEALGRLPPDAHDLRARLLGRKAAAMTPAAEPDEPLRLAREALATVATSADPHSVMEVAVSAGSALGDFAPPLERAGVNRRLVQLARAERDRVLELRGLSRLVTDCLAAGDVVGADATLLERDALAASLGHVRFRWATPLFRAMRAMIEGRFDVCDDAYREAAELVGAAQDPNGPRSLAVHRMMVLLLQDRHDDLRAGLPDVLRHLDAMPAFAECVRAGVLARVGELGTAVRHLRASAGEHLHHVRAGNMLGVLADTSVLCGERDIARRIRPLLEPHLDSNMTLSLFGYSCHPPMRALAARIDHALGDVAAAHAGFERALERTLAMGARAHEAWVRLWYGETLGAADPAGRALLQRSADLAHAHTMPGVAVRAEKLLGSSRPPSPSTALVMERHGAGWRLDRPSGALVLPDLKGLEMLARLLARPGEELHCLELAATTGEGAANETGADAGDAGELLDEKAKRAYRQRIETLSERVTECEARADAEGAERARSELESLARELSRAVGLGGRSRRAGSAAERARTAVQRRLKEAVRRIAELDAELGAHLERTLRTGSFCAYEPHRRPRSDR